MIYVCRGCLASQGRVPIYPWEEAICGLCGEYTESVRVKDETVAGFDMKRIEKRQKRLQEMRKASVQKHGIYIP